MASVSGCAREPAADCWPDAEPRAAHGWLPDRWRRAGAQGGFGEDPTCVASFEVAGVPPGS
jgi:hypothetical protein